MKRNNRLTLIELEAELNELKAEPLYLRIVELQKEITALKNKNNKEVIEDFLKENKNRLVRIKGSTHKGIIQDAYIERGNVVTKVLTYGYNRNKRFINYKLNEIDIIGKYIPPVVKNIK